jgi:hypothetical protein
MSANVASGRIFERTVTGNDQELVILANVVDLYIGKGGDYLLLGREFSTLLELKIANGSRQGEVAVHAAKVYKATCGLDAGFLGWDTSGFVHNHRLINAPSFCGL